MMLKFFLILSLFIFSLCFSNQFEPLEAKIVRQEIEKLESDLDCILGTYPNQIPNPKYALDEPQYMYFYKLGEIAGLNYAINIMEDGY